MEKGASVLSLVVSLVLWFVLMVLLLTAVGFGVGQLELAIWFVVLALGCWWLVRRHRRAGAGV